MSSIGAYVSVLYGSMSLHKLLMYSGLALKKEKQVAIKKESCESKVVSKEIVGQSKNAPSIDHKSFPTITVPQISNPSTIPQTTEAKVPVTSSYSKLNTDPMKRPRPVILPKPYGIVQSLLDARLVLGRLSQTTKTNTTSVISSGQYMAPSTHKPTVSLPKHTVKLVAVPSTIPSVKIDSLLQSAIAQQTNVTVGALTNIVSNQHTPGGSSVMATSAAPSTSVPASIKNEKSLNLPKAMPQVHLPRSLGHASPVPATLATTISNRLSALISNPVTTAAPITGVQKKPVNLDSLVDKPHGNNKAPIKKTAVVQTNQTPDSFYKQPQLAEPLPSSTVGIITPGGGGIILGGSGKGSSSTPPKQRVLTLPVCRMGPLIARKSENVEASVSTVVREDITCVSCPSMSLNSPIKSPVEQILKEHSYLGSPIPPVPPDIPSQQSVFSTDTQQQVHKDK